MEGDNKSAISQAIIKIKRRYSRFNLVNVNANGKKIVSNCSKAVLLRKPVCENGFMIKVDLKPSGMINADMVASTKS